jgi:cardiolipin synthase
VLPRLSIGHWLTLHGLITVFAVFVYVLASHVMRQRRHPSAAIGWVLFILLVPYAALPVYLLFGTRKLIQRAETSGTAGTSATDGAANTWLGQVTAALGQPAPAAYRALQLHADGAQAQQAIFEVIDNARFTLDICTFIIGRDDLGQAIAGRLAAKAREGVAVRLLLDGAGSIMGGQVDLSAARRAGVRIGLFVPSWRAPFKGHLNLRNHRKLAVADAGRENERMWCGGRNLAAEYFTGRSGQAPWHDLSFDLHGPLVRQAADLFAGDWSFAQGGKDATFGKGGAPTPATAIAASAQSPPGATGQVIASGPDQADDTVHALLVSAAYQARARIALVSPYVVLEDALLMALCLAARRGVAVDLLLPARSNHRLADIARHRSLRALAAAGVRVWLAPQMLHAKAAIIDDDLALAGSANLDGRSLFLNYELMVAFHEAGDVARFGAWFDHERGTATAYVAQAPGLWRDLGEGLMLWIGFQI